MGCCRSSIATRSERPSHSVPFGASLESMIGHTSADWDARYSETPAPWGGTPAAAIVERLSTMEPGTALDLGCGDGRHARLLAQMGWDVVGVDLSPEAIRIAKGHESLGAEIVYTVGDVCNWVPVYDAQVTKDDRFTSGKFDLVLAAYLHLPMQQLCDVLKHSQAWLNPQGALLYLGHAAENLRHGIGGPQDSALLPTVADLAQASLGMRVIRLEHMVRPAGHAQAVDVLLHAKNWS